MPRHHREGHHGARVGWLRAAVLGANDGIVSTASLMVGVAAAGTDHAHLVLTGLAGLVAGAMSMAAGEFVSVHAQADTEAADLARERREIETQGVAEHQELAAIYVGRGLTPVLAREVAEQLMAHDALGAHARDELGLNRETRPRPLQAAAASAASFAVGAAMPLAVAVVAGGPWRIAWMSVSAIGFLGVLGALSARIGGSSASVAAGRVMFWGALALLVTAGAGRWFGAAV